MEPVNARLQETVMQRWDSIDEDERRLVFAYVTAVKPSLAVACLNSARDVADSVAEHLLS